MLRPPYLLGAVALAALGLVACTRVVEGTPAAPSTSAPAPSPQPSGTQSGFHDCSAVLSIKGIKIAAALQGKLTAQCGVVPVPLDYADPDGASANIVVVRVHDSDNPGDTPLLLNPGGPGGSGVSLALGILAKISPTIVQHYDLVGFDPRGVALSQPAISCLSDAERDAYTAASPDVTTSSGFIAAKAAAAQFARDCQAHTDGLQYYDTVDSARDMDELRVALGQQTLDYLGFSYGTQLGSVYAHLFPRRVGAMVLDGAIDPLTSGVDQSTFQLQGFEKAYGQFAAYCHKTAPCSELDDPVRTAVGIENAALSQPLPTGTNRKLTANLASTGIQEAMYSKDLWPRLGKALVQANNGDGTGLLALADEYNHRTSDGKYVNLIDAFNVISCNDASPGPTDTQIRTTAADWAAKYPIFGKWFAIGLFTCQSWQPHRTIPPKPTAHTPRPVLVLGNVHDPATPYQGAVNLAKTMGHAEVLSWDGEGHTSYLNGSSCVDKYVTSYLVTRVLPPDDTTCPA